MANIHKKPRIYTPEERLALVTEIDRQLRAGRGSLLAIAASLGTSHTNCYNWVKAGVKPAPAAVPPPPASLRTAAHRTYSPDERDHLMAEAGAHNRLLAAPWRIDRARPQAMSALRRTRSMVEWWTCSW